MQLVICTLFELIILSPVHPRELRTSVSPVSATAEGASAVVECILNLCPVLLRRAWTSAYPVSCALVALRPYFLCQFLPRAPPARLDFGLSVSYAPEGASAPSVLDRTLN